MYFNSFKPSISYIIKCKQSIIEHASIQQSYLNDEEIIMIGLVYIRCDYRKFGFGEFLTNYLFNIKSKEINTIHANILIEHIPFYIRYGFKRSFSLIGSIGRLNQINNINISIDDDIIIDLYESSNINHIAIYDNSIYPINHIKFFEKLRGNISSIAGYVARSKKTNLIKGYIILNFSRLFIKCGPLYADNISIALLLLKCCAYHYDGIMLLSVPETNPHAIQLFKSNHFKQTDILHRVYKGNQLFFNQSIFQRILAIRDDWFSFI
ncbi:unnamed protein product [Rotaria sp. Silwood2]|nr:unnamed protein product [Rotaria sp. Silwood2]